MKRIKNRQCIAKAKKEMAFALIELGRNEEAESCLDDSDKIIKDLGREYYYAHNLQLRAMLKFKRMDFKSAKELLQESIAISMQEGDQSNVNNCRMMLNILERM